MHEYSMPFDQAFERFPLAVARALRGAARERMGHPPEQDYTLDAGAAEAAKHKRWMRENCIIIP